MRIKSIVKRKKSVNLLRTINLYLNFKSFLVLDLEECLLSYFIFNKLYKDFIIVHSSSLNKLYLFNNLNFWGGNVYLCFFKSNNFFLNIKYIYDNIHILHLYNIKIIGYIFNGFFVNFFNYINKDFYAFLMEDNFLSLKNYIFLYFFILYLLLIQFIIDVVDNIALLIKC